MHYYIYIYSYGSMLLLDYFLSINHTICMFAVGLFEPLSYQDRAVQLAYDNTTVSVCYESLSAFSGTASWQDGKLFVG